jgi:hypothetical protein
MVDLERTYEIKFRVTMAEAAFEKKKNLSPAIWTSEKLVKVLLLEHSFVWS